VLIFPSRCLLDGLADALIRATPADIALHGRIDVLVRRFRRLPQQRHGLHDLPTLTVAALWHIKRLPGLLDRMVTMGAQAFNGHNVLARSAAHQRDTTARGGAVDVHGAGAAESHAAPVLGPGQLQQVAEVPQQRHLRIAIERTLKAIDLALDHGLTSL